MKKRDPIDENEERLDRAALIDAKRRRAKIAETIIAALPVDELDALIDAALADVLLDRLIMRANRQELRRGPRAYVVD